MAFGRHLPRLPCALKVLHLQRARVHLLCKATGKGVGHMPTTQVVTVKPHGTTGPHEVLKP